ncbi:MAG: hypothetical protein N4A33_01940 [Bacteriovoracaceae bacterium]|jgi:D-lactate dehydrogenase|nr:hypothetical protein [Bacteriovoracaceae bacterium]
MKKITCFSTHEFEQKNLTLIAQKLGLTIQFIKYKLDKHTASFAKESDAILCWANDDLSKETLEVLYHNGLKYISLRTAGFSNLDIKTAQDLKLKVSRVPSYSPQSIAEHTAALLLSLNRKIIKASNRVKDFNFSLEGLEGMQIFGKTVGIIGAGQIGKAFANIMLGFGCKVLIYDQKIDPELEKMQNITYTNLLDIFKNVDILSLHCPLNEQTKYIINKDSLNRMKKISLLLILEEVG